MRDWLRVLVTVLVVSAAAPAAAAPSWAGSAPADLQDDARTAPASVSGTGPVETTDASSPLSLEDRPITRVPGRASRADGQPPSSSGGWVVWLQTLGILGVVLAVMGFVLQWLRKAGVGRSFGGSTAAVQILSRGYLTNKHQMVLVRFGGRILLVGLGPQNVELLSELTDPQEAAQVLTRIEGAKAGSASREFQETMDAASHEYDRLDGAAADDGPTGPAQSESDVGRLRHELKALIGKMQSIQGK